MGLRRYVNLSIIVVAIKQYTAVGNGEGQG